MFSKASVEAGPATQWVTPPASVALEDRDLKRNATYRPDIDGLRAFAVLSVIGFHFCPSAVPGGFIGVSVFFTISGFLVCDVIEAKRDVDQFELGSYYLRRWLRIVPAAYVLITLVLCVSFGMQAVDDAKRVAESGIAALAGCANVYFWAAQDSSYFAASAAESPLLHLWSLGVEEQFFLVLPLMLNLSVYIHRAGVFLCCFTLCILCLVAACYWQQHISLTYYLLLFRAPELLVGVMTSQAVRMFKAQESSRWSTSWWLPEVEQLVSVAGMLLLFLSLFFFSEAAPYPSYRAIFISATAGCIIITGSFRRHLVHRTLLSNVCFVMVGKMSYSLYLYHWPVKSYLMYFRVSITWLVLAICTVGITCASVLSYRFIENEFRASRRIPLSKLVLLRALAVVSVLGFLGIAGFPLRAPVVVESAMPMSSSRMSGFTHDEVMAHAVRARERKDTDSTRYFNAKNFNNTGGIGQTNTRTAFVLVGDSFAEHLFPALDELGLKYKYKFPVFAHAGCPVSIALHPDELDANPLRGKACQEKMGSFREFVNSFTCVIISQHWEFYFTHFPRAETLLNETLSYLGSLHKRVVLFGRVPHFPLFDYRTPKKQLKVPRSNPMNEKLKRLMMPHHNVDYMEFQPYMCDGDLCSSTFNDNTPIMHNAGHLCARGAREIGQQIIKREGLPWALERCIGR